MSVTGGILPRGFLHKKRGGTMGGAIAMGNNNISAVKTLTHNGEIANGDSGAAKTIDWTAGMKQSVTLSANCTFTFTAPAGPCNIVLKFINGGAFTPTWPTILWAGGAEPTWTTAGTDIIAFYFDGTNYYGAATLDFS